MARKTAKSESEKPWIQYAKDVVNDKIVVGKYIKQSCQQYLNYINSDKYELRNNVVERAIKFISLFKHFKGKSSGKPFILQPWQMWVISAIVGVYHRGTTKRKHNSIYLEISRKNGKTALCAALSLYFLIADGQDGAECACLANSREQAKICYEFCQVWAKQLDPKQKNLKILRDRIKFDVNNSKLLVCSSADDKLDGGNYTAAIVDEFHAAKSNKLRDVIKSSMVRENSVLITITSAGFDKTGPCYKLRTTCTEILAGLKDDDSMFSAIYSLDDGDIWTDKKCWVKCTPNLDVTVTTDYIERQVKSAQNNPSEETGVRTKTLNEWLSTSEVWIPDNYINSSCKKLNLDDFAECETFVGIDLAAVGDLTAVSYLHKKEDDEKYYFHTDLYAPETVLTENVNKEYYKYLVRQKALKLTAGNVTDYDVILTDILKNNEKFMIRKIAYDSWNASFFVVKATEAGLPMEPYSQSISNFNKPVRELERLIRSGKVQINYNEAINWMFRNIRLKSDHNDNIKPVKANTASKIDGVIAMLQALGVYLDTPHYNNEIFVI